MAGARHTVVFAVLCLASGLSAQTSEGPKPGIIAFTFVDSYTKLPIKDANIRIRQLGGTTASGTSNDAGEVEFTDLPPDRYFFSSIQAPGYTFDLLSQREGMPVRAGERLKLTIPIDPSSAISGSVVDTDGTPLSGVTVQTLSSDPAASLSAIKGVTTGSDGTYMIEGLKPGRFVVRVVANPKVRIPQTYYPNGDDAAQAARVEVAPGREGARIDFRLRRVPVFSLRGSIAGTPDNARADGFLWTCEAGRREPLVTLNKINVGIDGAFDMAVVPGSYCIQFQTSENNRPTSFFSGTIRVTDRDLNDLRFTFVRPTEITGTVKLEEGAGLRMPPSVNLMPSRGINLPQPPSAEVRPDGTFRITEVLPLDYGLFMEAGGGYVKSIKLGGLDMVDGQLNMSSGSGPLVIEIAAARGRAKVNVNLGSAKPAQALVVLIPTSSASFRSDVVKMVPANERGEATLEGIAPGLYNAYAFAEPDSRVLNAWEFLKLFPSVAVRISGNEQADISLRLIPKSEFEDARSRF